jgi:hypothetical protein
MFPPWHVRHFALLLLVLSAPAYSEEARTVHPYLSENFFIDVGIFFPNRTFGVAVDGSIGDDHDLIEFEESFNLNEKDRIFALEFGWRFGDKWRLVGQYFESKGGSSVILEEDVEWADVVFQAGTSASAGASLTLIRAFFGREFRSGKMHEFGFGAGIHWLEIGAFIEGTILVEGGETAAAAESVRAHAPLPNIGVWYNYSITERWALRARADIFSAEIDRYDGTMLNLALGVDYQIATNFGVGLNYNFFDIDVKIDQSDWRGRIVTSHEGLYLNLSFYW